MAGPAQAAAEPEPSAIQRTVIGLFEDAIDAEHALAALRSARHPSDRVSLLVRDESGDAERGSDRAGAVARAIVANTLDAVAGWLQGLASLIVPERGAFLVAGPIGAALAGGVGGHPASTRAGDATEMEPRWLLSTLAGFGFSADEATYLERRLDAGATLLAVTSAEGEALDSVRHLFADHDAVHIGFAQSDTGLVELSEELLAARPEQLGGGDVVVADVVAPLRRASRYGEAAPLAGLRHRRVVDVDGEEAGTVEDVIVEVVDPDGPSGPAPEQAVPRYIVVGHGGVLGIGRHLSIVPIALADVAGDPVALSVRRDSLREAPAYEVHAPLTRRDERAIAEHFGVRPYWRDE